MTQAAGPAGIVPPTAEGGAAVALSARGLTKAFGATQALRAFSFDLRAGEVHCVVGENGSGKSTLVKLLAGVHRPDAGEIVLGERSLRAIRAPRESIALGIGTVFQEVLVVEARSVVENVWLGVDGVLRPVVDQATRRRRAAEMLGRLLQAPPDLDTPVEQLSLSDRQACCLARALVRDPRILILDEATSALDVQTRDRLLQIVRERVAAGGAVIFISHRMDEIAQIGDRCTVMRSGEAVATLERGEASAGELVRLMTGADHLTDAVAERVRPPLGRVVLDVPGLTLREGELVGLAGLEGHGQAAFLEGLWSAGGDGLAYVPRERRAESLFESKSIRENFAIVTLGQDRRYGLISPASGRSRLAGYVERLGVRLGRPEDLITTLSGGNQQKVIIARWLATAPRVLLLNDPTRGIDINAKRDLYALLAELTQEGVAVVMLSTEVDEHVELMDRVLVFREQRIAAEIPRERLTRQALVGAFFGQEAVADA